MVKATRQHAIGDLIDGLAVTAGGDGVGAVVVDGVADDSREVARGDLFVARPGTRVDGRRFIGEAVARGAVAVLTDRADDVPDGVVALLADDVPLAAAAIAERLFDEPARRLSVVGVTGTNGKSTIVHLVRHLLRASGRRCGIIGTIEIDDGAASRPARLTTPGAIELPVLFQTMRDHGCVACAMEVSSHALDQRRVAAIPFVGAVFTNLTGDHLDYHGSIEAYVAAKRRLFGMLAPEAWVVQNADVPWAAEVVGDTRATVITTSLERDDATAGARIVGVALDRTSVRLRGPWGVIEADLPFPGRHNVMNALQATVVAHQLGADVEQLLVGLASATLPAGRLERITTPTDPVAVFVDYAHTDDALEHALRALRPVLPAGGRLWVVFGCGGDRDRSKRPRMAAVACRLADRVIVTSDNPRTEDPEAIIDEIMPGVPEARRASVVRDADRAAAIERAIAGATTGDVVLIAGKGHEDYQIIGEQRRHFDDREIARQAVAARRQGVAHS